jgi:hypothetical protein
LDLVQGKPKHYIRGGLTAAILSRAGYRVLLIEKAKYTHPSDYPLTEFQSYNLLYERGGFLATDDGGMQLLAGKSWGGGTTVNWSASLELPQCTRKELADTYGLKYYNTKDYAEDIEFIRKRLGMDTKAISHNIPNQILIDGCKRLKYKVEDIPQNTAGNTHRFINFILVAAGVGSVVLMVKNSRAW